MQNTRTTSLLAMIGLGAGLALTVSGCTGSDDEPAPTVPATAAPAATATPTAGRVSGATSAPSTPPPAPSAAQASAIGTVPATCDDVVTPGAFDYIDEVPLNDPAIVGDLEVPRTAFTPARQISGQRLYCVWRDPRADLTSLTIQVEDVIPSRAIEALRGLSGFDCTSIYDGRRCQKLTQNPQYSVTEVDTYFSRGNIGIRITESNVPTEGLLGDVVGNVFG